MINYYNAINVYTDSSITTDLKTNKFISCSGFVTVLHNEIIDNGYKIMYESTNNYGELYAIYLGLQSLLKYKTDPNIFLNLFSDSKISIFGLTQWIYQWVKNIDSNFLLRSSTGSIVKNQELYSKIIYYVVHNNTHLSMYHQLGHMNCKRQSDLEKTIDKFELYNKENINEDIAREICYYNDFIDNTSRNILLKTTSDKTFNKNNYLKPIGVVDRVISNDIIKLYKKLIN